MNWTFNQNCQLIIEALPNKGDYEHLLEVIIYPNSAIDVFVDRIEDTLIVDIPEDGLYTYKYLLTNLDPSTIDISTISSPNNSIGDWNGSENIFSLCHLRKCAIAHEKQAIEEFLGTCHKQNCNKKSSQQTTRDMLLIILFVLEHLICQEKYSEAERIIESTRSCSNFCTNNVIKKCCCNG